MTGKGFLFAMAFFVIVPAAVCHADDLPMCSNRVINEVTKRVGCTVGDANCWLSKGGMCMDHVLQKAGRTGTPFRMDRQVRPEDVRKGDVALFISRAHYAYVERVIRDKNGKPAAVDLSEYNYGTCWVDRSTMVTDHYKKVNKRFSVPVSSVDGGFLRP